MSGNTHQRFGKSLIRSLHGRAVATARALVKDITIFQPYQWTICREG